MTPQFRRDPGWWIDACRRQFRHRGGVAIDTALAEQSKQALQAANVPGWTYHVEEGTFSAYIDTVTSRIGPSSYCDSSALTSLDPTGPAEQVAADIKAAFDTYLPVGAP